MFALNSIKVPWLQHKYKINSNACFECSYEQLMIDCGKCTVTNFVEFYFDKTIRMMEFSAKDGYDGKNKVCS